MREFLEAEQGETETPNISDKTATFQVEKYKTLRAEITRWSLDIRFYERVGVVGPSALYSWLFINQGADARPSALLAL